MSELLSIGATNSADSAAITSGRTPVVKIALDVNEDVRIVHFLARLAVLFLDSDSLGHVCGGTVYIEMCKETCSRSGRRQIAPFCHGAAKN